MTRFEQPSKYFRCWRTKYVEEIFTFKTYSTEPVKIEKFPIHYVNSNTRKLTNRYSILVQQLIVNPSTYVFWNNIQKQNSDAGSFYPQQPYQIRGNIKNIDDEDDFGDYDDDDFDDDYDDEDYDDDDFY